MYRYGLDFDPSIIMSLRNSYWLNLAANCQRLPLAMNGVHVQEPPLPRRRRSMAYLPRLEVSSHGSSFAVYTVPSHSPMTSHYRSVFLPLLRHLHGHSSYNKIFLTSTLSDTFTPSLAPGPICAHCSQRAIRPLPSGVSWRRRMNLSWMNWCLRFKNQKSLLRTPDSRSSWIQHLSRDQT